MIKKYWILFAILSLSAFTHLYNPVGFPDIFYDEGIYMSRAMNFLDTGNPQESFLYDHPYFGQILLGGMMWVTNFPDSVNQDTDPESLQQLYLVPRIFMGILAVLDTFLIYKIAYTRYSRNVAIISAVLFAVMPFSWIFKRILLDSLLLPILLGSILFALKANQKYHPSIMITLSGILLGLSIFTKIPAFVFMVLIGWIVFCRKNIYNVGLWLVPVFFIPSIWIVYVITQNDFDLWFKDVLWHTQRESAGLYITKYFIDIDPVLFGLGIAGIAYSVYRKDLFVLLWTVPMVLFLGTMGFTQYFHWIPLIPIFCIAGAILIVKSIEKIKHAEKLMLASIMILVIFGLASTIPLIVTDMSSSQFQAMSFVLNDVDTENVTILASPVYAWVFDYYGLDNVMLDYSIILFEEPQTDKVLLIADNHYIIDLSRGSELQELYDETQSLIVFENSISEYDTWIYPYTSLKFNMEGSVIDVRISD